MEILWYGTGIVVLILFIFAWIGMDGLEYERKNRRPPDDKYPSYNNIQVTTTSIKINNISPILHFHVKLFTKIWTKPVQNVEKCTGFVPSF